MEVKAIKLSEIDCDVIPSIRPINKNSSAYKKLKFAIDQDSQRSPITIRLLTDPERAKVAENAIYGIIDGHHRFNISLELGQEKILAIINESDSEDDSDYRDIVLAYRLNESTIKMSSLEKGKVIYELTKRTQKDISQIGEEIFGFKKSMSYKTVNAYRKSICESTVQKPREAQFSEELLTETFKSLSQDLSTVTTEKEKCKEQLEKIKTIQKQLDYFKAILKANLKAEN